MSTKIQWTEETWNPITGCTKISEGCKNCYAEKMHTRLRAMGQAKYQHDFTEVHFHQDQLQKHFSKNKMVFINSMSDLCHKDVKPEWINHILISAKVQPAIFQVLTKRSERLKTIVFPDNVWAGVTVESSEYRHRIQDLRQTRAATRFISFEPLLDDVDNPEDGGIDLTHIHWVIVGCESGYNARPCKIEWIENIVKNCIDQNIPVFVKQANINGKLIKMPEILGKVWNQYPNDR